MPRFPKLKPKSIEMTPEERLKLAEEKFNIWFCHGPKKHYMEVIDKLFEYFEAEIQYKLEKLGKLK